MRRCAARKSPRRAPAKVAPIDQELMDLAAVIAEHKLEDNAKGWFTMPWRDGWNAVGVALALHEATERCAAFTWLHTVCAVHQVAAWHPTGPLVRAREVIDPALYWVAEEEMLDVSSAAPCGRAALRCLQVLVANSSGGGHAYNAILTPAFQRFAPSEVADEIMEYRCRDSIGTTAVLQGDANDRQRGAFRTAWSRGLYVAAYAIPSATVIGQMRVIK